MKFGIIGFGKMGRIRAKAIEECGGEVLVVYEEDKKVDVSPYVRVENFTDFFENKNIDGIFICTPNLWNHGFTIQGLRNNKHVFCEKPPAITYEKLQFVLIAEKKSNKKLMYGFNHRHHDSVQQIKSIVDSKEMGDILWMRGRYGKNINPEALDNWRFKKEYSGGGILIDQGIHMLDLFLYMADDFDEVKSVVSSRGFTVGISGAHRRRPRIQRRIRSFRVSPIAELRPSCDRLRSGRADLGATRTICVEKSREVLQRSAVGN